MSFITSSPGANLFLGACLKTITANVSMILFNWEHALQELDMGLIELFPSVCQLGRIRVDWLLQWNSTNI